MSTQVALWNPLFAGCHGVVFVGADLNALDETFTFSFSKADVAEAFSTSTIGLYKFVLQYSHDSIRITVFARQHSCDSMRVTVFV